MTYRNGTYIAFDGRDTTNPLESDIKYFNLLKAWKEKDDEFTFSDSHKKNYQVRDTSTKETLKRRLYERLKNSKNMILILSEKTRNDREMLSYEIKKAIELGMPIIICYAEIGYGFQNIDGLNKYWPISLSAEIYGGAIKCIHIPFRKEPILDAISRFSIHETNTLGPYSCYRKEVYNYWGISNVTDNLLG